MGGPGPQVRRAADGASSASGRAADQQSQAAAGTFSSFIRKQFKWPLQVAQAVYSAPRNLSDSARRVTRALASHLRDNSQDYMFLYELLSVSLPLLLVLQDVLQQMHAEPPADGPGSLQPLLSWLQEQVGHRLI